MTTLKPEKSGRTPDPLHVVLDWLCLILCDEEELYCQRSKLYRFRDAEWKEQITENRLRDRAHLSY